MDFGLLILVFSLLGIVCGFASDAYNPFAHL